YFDDVRRDLIMNAGRTLLGLAFHPHQAWISVDAVLRVVWRSFVTRRKMLEWVTAAQAERGAADRRIASAYRWMWPSLVVAAVATIGLALMRPSAFVVAFPFL